MLKNMDANPQPTIGIGNKGNRRTLLIVVAAVLIIGLLAFAASPPAANPADQNSGSSHSAAQDGTLALYTWLDKIGYKAERIEYGPFDIPTDADALFIIEPGATLTQIEHENLLTWVRGGGILIWAESGLETSQVLRDWNISLVASSKPYDKLNPAQPMLYPDVAEASVGTNYALDTSKRKDATTIYLGTKAAALLVGFNEGAGHVYVTSAPHLFSNLGLGEANNWALTLNLLVGILKGGKIALDEVHHGYTGGDDLSTVLFTQRWGWGILYAAALVALYLVLSGRRFGRIVPLVPPDTRRSSGEYVAAVGSLFRRAARRNWVVDHYRATLRADLARPFGIDPRLPAPTFVAELARLSPRPLDRNLLLTVLSELDIAGSAERYSEAALLDLSRRADAARKMALGLDVGPLQPVHTEGQRYFAAVMQVMLDQVPDDPAS